MRLQPNIKSSSHGFSNNQLAATNTATTLENRGNQMIAGLGLVFGAAIGAVINAIFGTSLISVGVGAGIGLVLGAAVDATRRKASR